jgi:hypothetical protein
MLKTLQMKQNTEEEYPHETGIALVNATSYTDKRSKEAMELMSS